jgi:hypothetical protein
MTALAGAVDICGKTALSLPLVQLVNIGTSLFDLHPIILQQVLLPWSNVRKGDAP